MSYRERAGRSGDKTTRLAINPVDLVAPPPGTLGPGPAQVGILRPAVPLDQHLAVEGRHLDVALGGLHRSLVVEALDRVVDHAREWTRVNRLGNCLGHIVRDEYLGCLGGAAEVVFCQAAEENGRSVTSPIAHPDFPQMEMWT